MPRTRKTMSGDPAQSSRTGAPGVRYGEGKDLAAMREAAPIPNARAGGSSPPPARQPGLPVEASPPLSPAPIQAPPKPGLLLAPTARPNEPVTTGLRHGPGAGPEILRGGPVESPTGKLLRELARVTGRTRFNDLARRSGL